MTLDQIVVGNSPDDDDQLTVTLRGAPAALVQTLVHGLDFDSALALKEALEVELAKRAARERTSR